MFRGIYNQLKSVNTPNLIKSGIASAKHARHGAVEKQNCEEIDHTPPEGWVRAKKFCITFDTNFGRYLPRGTIIDGSRKCRMGAFCTIAKISGEMPKKALKTGQNGVKIFLGPHTYWIITFLAFFYFQFFLILVLYRSSILWKLVLKTGSYKYQNEKYWK